MKKFKITVDGKVYDVEVEELRDSSSPSPRVQVPVTPPQQNHLPQTSPVNSPQPHSGQGNLVSPMPGTIIKVLVAEGDMVEIGQQVIVLEAMKMENSINASSSGKVTQINVATGQSVDTGQLLLVIE